MDLSQSSSSSATAEQPKVSLFRARKAPNTTAFRKREEENVKLKAKEGSGESGGEDDGSDSGSSDTSSTDARPIKLAEKRKQLRGRNLIHTTSKKRRKAIDALAEEESSSSSPEDGGTSMAEGKFDPDVKFDSSGQQRMGPGDMGATARNEVDTDYGRDSQSQFERIQTMLRKEREVREKREAEEEEDRKKYGERAKLSKLQQEPSSSQPKVYRGMALYGAREREDTIKGNATSGLNRLGPIRATQYMRASVRWDYAPDICKDYKETGFCTFGDSCKFMHDRTDYKHGWEIERDWEAGKLKEAKEDEYLISSEEGEEEEGGKLPHSCYICREHFRNPVVTKCKHYFCEECALKHYQKSKKCVVCGEKTEGVFNVAREILAKMKEREDAKAKQAEEEELIDESEKREVEAKILPMADEPKDEENESSADDGEEDD